MSLIDVLERIKKQSEDKKTADYLKRTVPVSALGIAGGMTPGFEILSGASIPPVYREPEPVPELPKMGMGQEFIHSLGRVPSQTVSQILDMAAFVSGSKSLHEASEISQQLGRKDFPSDAPQLSSMDELSNASIGDITRYAVAESGQALASIGSMMIPGAAARVVAAPVVKALVGYSPKMAKLVSAVGGAEKAAEYISAYAGGSLLEAGSISAEAFQKTGEMPERLRVAPWAMIAGAFESMEPILLLSRLRKVVPDVAEEAAKKSGRDLVKYVLGYAKDMGFEGGTEFAQTLLEEAGAEYATGKTLAESFGSLGMDSFARAIAAGISGSTGGGLMRGAADTGSLFLDKKQAGGIDPVEPPTAGPNTDITIPEPVKPTPGAQASAADEVIPPQYQDQLLGAVEKAKQSTAKSDVGENDHPVQAGAKKLIRKINDTLAGIGVTGDMVNQFATEIGGSPIESMQLPQLQQVYQAAVTLAAQGHTVAAPIQVPPPVDPVADAVSPLISAGKNMTATLDDMQNRVLPKYEDIANRVSRLNAPLPPENIEQAIAIAQQQAQIKQAQSTAPQMTQPARQPMGITQPEMEPRKLVPMPKLPTVEQINAMEQEELDAARKAIGGILYAKPDEYPVEVIEAADALDAAAAKRQESLNIKREEEDEKPIYSKFVPHESGDISAEMTYAIRPEAYQKIYGKPGAIVSIQLKGKGLKSETGFMSVAGITAADTSPEGLRGLMDRVIAEQSKPVAKPAKTKKSDREKPRDLPGIATVAPQTALDRYYEAWSKSTESTLMTKEKMAETMNKAADSAIKTGSFAFRSGNPLTPARHEALKEILAGRGYELGELKEDGPGVLTAEARPIAAATEPELTLEQQLAEAKEQLKQAEYQPIKAGGVPVMDARKEQRKRELREKIQRLEAEIEAATQPTPALSPEPAPAPAAAPSYGETNTLVSKSRYEELKAKFNSKTKNIASGIDPELMAITAEMAVYHLEAGARKFADFAKAIIADVGESFRPYLKSAYLSAKYFPGAEKYRAEMDSESDIDAAVEPVVEPEPAAPVTKAEPDIVRLSESLVPAVESMMTADKPMDNRQLKKIVSDLGMDPENHKLTQEALEGAITRVIRKNNLYKDFYRLKKIYDNMPNLNERTGGSMTRQAYSTPHILTSILTNALDLSGESVSIYEPTAGNGLLLSGVVENQEGTKNTYFLNEIDKYRNQTLKSLFPEAEITNEDATTFAGPDIMVDLVFTNPPFGSIEDKIVQPIQGNKTDIRMKKLEHYIAWQALSNMRENGKAIVILGAEKENKISSGSHETFTRAMYNQFNITGHFEIDGQFYRKMGAEWPVEIYVIEGRKNFPGNREMISPPKSVRRIAYAEGWEGVRSYVEESVKSGEYINRASDINRGKRGGDNAAKPQGNNIIPAGQRSDTRPETEERPVDGPEPVSTQTRIEPEQQPVAGSQRDTGERRDTERIERVKRELAGEGEARQEQRRDTTTPDAAESGVDDSGLIGVADDLQIPYDRVSENRSVGALVPKNLAAPTRSALVSILEESGEKSLDDYVAKQLGYDDGKDIPFFAGEQVDALAQTFRSLNRKGGNIVADQTGLGKGRVGAGAIQWAAQHGKIPVFITEKVGLFNDMYRDLRDIGQGALRPFMFNDNGEMSYEDEEGNKHIAFKHKKQVFAEVYQRMLEGDYSDFTGPNKKFDYIALTYSQINKGDESRKTTPVLKIDAFNGIKNAVLILDESHVAAGAAGDVNKEGGEGRKKKKDSGSNQMGNVLKLLDRSRSDGVVYMSATWAKTPENVPVYYRAFDQANLNIDEISTAFKRGDLAMQELVVSSMASKGTYIRREQSYAGVNWNVNRTTEKTEQADKERSLADRAMAEVRELIMLDREISQELMSLNITELIDTFQIPIPEQYIGGQTDGKSRIASSLDSPGSPFSGVHNYINAFLASIKADRAAARAIEMVKAGQKPVISIQNTMESHMDTLLELGNGDVGDPFGGTYGDILESNVEKLFVVKIKNPNDNNDIFTFKIPMEALSYEAQSAVRDFKARLAKADLSDLPFSPIDAVKAKIAKAGFTVGEITGRGKYLDYNDTVDGKPILKARPGSETTNQGKRKTLNQFNSGELDVLVINSSGATGLSAHSSEKFKDQRQRAMIILQPFDDINTFTQMLGRIHRTGAVYSESAATSKITGKPAVYGKPFYEYIQSSLGMEERPAARLQAKMKSLNANTSSTKESRQKISDVDFANKYGTQVIRAWLQNPDNKAYAHALGYYELTDTKNATASQVTGRIAILPQQVQNAFRDQIIKEYQDRIEELNSIGMNDLMIPSYDQADAVTLEKNLIYGEEGSVTKPPIYVEKIQMTIPGNPTSLDAAINRGKMGSVPSDADIEKRDRAFEKYIELKKAEKAMYEATYNKPSGMNLDITERSAQSVKDLLNKLKPGDYVSGTIAFASKSVDGESKMEYRETIGVVTDIKLSPLPEGFVGNPWIPSNIKITMATPTTTGKIIVPISKMVTMYKREPDARLWAAKEKESATQRVTREVITGDMIKSGSMTSDTEIAQVQRRGGNRDFMWLSKDDTMEITAPLEELTEEQLNNPPNLMASMDADRDVTILLETRKIMVAYSSPYRSMLMADKQLSEILDPNDNDPFIKIKAAGSQKQFMVTKVWPTRKQLIEAAKRIHQLLKERGGGLMDLSAAQQVIHATKKKEDVSPTRSGLGRRGAIPADLAAIPAIAAKWAARKLTSALESAYNALVRGSGSFIDWIKTLAGEARRVAAEIWKDARKLAAAMKIPSLNRKGAIMSLSQAIKIAKEQLAQKPLPQSGEPAVSTEAATEVVKETAAEARKIGLAEGKVRSDKRAARLKESAAARYEKLKDKLGKLKKMNQAQRLIRTEGKKFLIDLANRLPVAERASLIRGIANADTILAQADVINRIDKLIDKVVRRNSAKRFQAALRGAKQLRPEFQSIADELKKNIVTRGHLVEALDAMNRYLLDNPTAIVSEERLETLQRLAADRSGKLSPATMDMFSELLETITFLSDQENERMFSNNAMTAAQSAAAIVSYVDKQPDISSTDESWAKWFFNVGSLQFEAIADMLGDAGRELFYGDMRRGERKAKSIWFAGRDAIHETMREIGLDPDDLKTAEWLDQDVGGMTRNERMNLVANLLDKSTREEIIRGGYKLKGAKKDEAAVQISERDADNMIASLDKKEAAMVKTMRRFLNTILKSAVNESWVQLAGYEKALADDYWPRTRDIKQTGLNEGYRKWMNTALEQLGIFKQREKSKAAVMIGGIMETYQNHIKKASTFAGLAVPIRNTEIVLAKISDKVESRYGKKYLNRVKEQLSAMADLGNPSGGEMNAGAAAVLNRVSISLLGANVRAAAKQFGGLFTASTEISPALLRDSMGDAFNEEVRQEMMDNSPILRDRYDSSGARLVSPTFDSGEDIVKTSRTDYYRRLLMLPLEKCDQAVSQIIWSAAKKELKATGLKGQELLTATAERAEQIVSRTQNVTSILDMSGVALEGRKSVWWKVMTLFQSQGNSIYNILRRAVKNYRTGKIDSAQLMGVVSLALAGNAVWSMVIGNLVTLRGWGDDDEEDKEKKTAKMISEITFDLLQENAGIFYGGSLFGAPFLRQAKRIVNKELIGLKDTRVQAGSARVENAMESAANSGLQAAEHFLTASLTAGQKIKTGPNRGKFKSEVELKKGIWKAARLTASMTGVPMILLNEGSNLLYDK